MIQRTILIKNYIVYTFYNKSYETQEAKHSISSFLLCTQYIKHLVIINPYPTAFPYGNNMVLHFYQQQDSSTTKTVHRVINKGLKTYV